MFRILSILIYGLDARTLTERDLKRIDGFWFRIFRRVVGIEASFYSRVPNTKVYVKAGKPEKPSTTLQYTQYSYKTMVEVFRASRPDLFTM